MGNDINLLIPLIKLFMTDMALQLAKLDQAFEDNDLDTARRAAHTIKGSAANLSALQLQSLAAELELLIKPLLTVSVILVEDETVLTQAVFVQKKSELRDASEIVMQRLAQYLSEHEQASQSSEESLTNEQLKNLLEPLMLKIQQGDYIEPQALDKLSTGVYDESLQQMIKQLLEQINAFDSKNATQSINDIMLRIKSASASADEVLHDIK
jgi:HPt (histidine-containing phosphotransfer) domain-containing protein